MLFLSVGAAYLFGLFTVYLATPHDLAWHLATSVDRVSRRWSCFSAGGLGRVPGHPGPPGGRRIRNEVNR